MNIRIGYLPIHILITYPHASHALTTRTRSLAPSPEHASSDVHALDTRTRARSLAPSSEHASSDAHTLATLTRARSLAPSSGHASSDVPPSPPAPEPAASHLRPGTPAPTPTPSSPAPAASHLRPGTPASTSTPSPPSPPAHAHAHAHASVQVHSTAHRSQLSPTNASEPVIDLMRSGNPPWASRGIIDRRKARAMGPAPHFSLHFQRRCSRATEGI